MLSEDEIVINKVAQDLLTLDEGLQWFKGCDSSRHKKIISSLLYYLEQSHPDQQLIDNSLENVPLKSTMTPIVLFKTHPFRVAVEKVYSLPTGEAEKSFITLLALFKYSDINRRETYCKMGCTHEWHNMV